MRSTAPCGPPWRAGAPARPPSSPSRRPSRAAPAQRSRRRGMRGPRTWSSSARRPCARRAPRRSNRPGRARVAVESPRACTPTPRGPSGRLRRRCLALRVFGSACLPQPHPSLELFRLVALVVSVRHVTLVLAEMLVHAGAVLVVLLAVPLVAVLAQVRLDAPERPTVRPHDRFSRTDSTGQHADAEDRGLRGPEHMFAEEEELRRVRDLLATRFG